MRRKKTGWSVLCIAVSCLCLMGCQDRDQQATKTRTPVQTSDAATQETPEAGKTSDTAQESRNPGETIDAAQQTKEPEENRDGQNSSSQTEQPLYLKGKRQNVLDITPRRKSRIYRTGQSARVEETLTAQKKVKAYPQENPLWAYNPYGTNPSSLYLYFTTEQKCSVRMTVHVKHKKIPDYTRTLSNGALGNVTTEHEYQLTGLVPGYRNHIRLELTDEQGNILSTLRYAVSMPKGSVPVIDRAIRKQYKNSEKEQLYAVVTGDKKGQYALGYYDRAGVLRASMPLEDNVAKSLNVVYDTLVYRTARDKLVRVNSLGQVMEVVSVRGYVPLSGMVSDDQGNLYFVGKKRENGRRYVICYNLGSRKIRKEVCLERYLSKGRKVSRILWKENCLYVKTGGTDKVIRLKYRLSQDGVKMRVKVRRQKHKKKNFWKETMPVTITSGKQVISAEDWTGLWYY